MSAIPDSRRKAEHKLATRKTLAAAIAEHPFLKDLSPDHLPVLADNAMWVQFEPGAFIQFEPSSSDWQLSRRP